MIIRFLTFCSFCCALLLSGCIQEQKSFTFDNACIVISPDPTSSVRLAATELQYFIHKTTGFCLEIISELPSEKTRAIFVGKKCVHRKNEISG